MSDTAAPTGDTVIVRKFGSMKRTLILWFMLMALLPMGIVSAISYQQAEASLRNDMQNSLNAAADSTIDFLRSWFDYRVIDLRSQSEGHVTKSLLSQLAKGLESSEAHTTEYVTSDDWARRMSKTETHLEDMVRVYDYLQNVYLVNTEGVIVYTAGENTGLGENLVNGPLSHTGLARVTNSSLASGQIAFSDLGYFPSSGNQIVGFLSAPVRDNLGTIIGSYAMQIDLAPIFRRTRAFSKGEGSLVHYLVGADGKLRTGLHDGTESVLQKNIETDEFKRWQNLRRAPADNTLRLEDRAAVYMGPNGNQVFGLHHSMELLGVNWVLISEIDQDEAFAATDWLGEITLALTLISGLLAAALAWNQARRITAPLIRLAVASRSVAAGNADQRVRISANNEIGALADDFNHMLETRQRYVDALEISEGLAKKALADLAMQKFAMDQHTIVAMTDVKGTITFVNDRFLEVSGYSRDELIGQNHRLLNSGDTDKDFWRDMYRTIASGNVWRGEIRNQAKDGNYYWVESTFVPFMGDDGKPKSYVAMRTDITGMKNSEAAAEAGSKAKSEFLANMSHEIRTPMNGVIGMTNLLLDTDLDRDQRERALTIKRSAESLLDIINDILDFSKIEAGKLDLEIVDFEMGTLLEDLASALFFRSGDKGLEFICPAEPVVDQWYQGDPGRIRQILTNLIANAIKFTEAGQVVVRMERTDHNKKSSMLRFTITDTGIGLDAEQRKKLFQKFTQADASTTRRYGGTGLGLTICKQLVELMGGAIGVISTPGEGSTFWFTLDLANAAARPPARRSDDLLNEKILVVDDSEVSLELLGMMLQAWQVEHVLVENGPAALETLREATQQGKPFSIAIIDMQMPGMDGAHLGTLIRDDAKLSFTRRVLLSSQARRGDAKRMHDSGFAAYLSKPVKQSELYNVLLQVAGISGETDNNPLITRHTTRELPQFEALLLVVEDNLTNQAVAKGMLKKFGIDIHLAGNGLEALSALESKRYDLVLMDCQMPEMDGYEATQKIRDPHSAVLDHSIPVLAMTANAMQGDREKCIEAGMNDHIAKPVDPTKLRRALEHWLPAECRPGADKPKTLNNAASRPITPAMTPAKPGNGKASESPAELVFDDAAMNERLMGDEALMQSVAEAFMDDMKEQIESLKNAASAGDIQQSSAQAHKIKGAAANVGGLVLSACAMEMEMAGKAGELHAIRHDLPQLERSFAELRTAMLETLF